MKRILAVLIVASLLFTSVAGFAEDLPDGSVSESSYVAQESGSDDASGSAEKAPEAAGSETGDDDIASGDKANDEPENMTKDGEPEVKDSEDEDSKDGEPEVEDSEDVDSEVEDSEVEDSEVEDSKDGEPEVEDSKVEEPAVKDSEDEDSKVEEPEVEDSEDEDSNVEDSEDEDSEDGEPEVEDSKVEDSEVEDSKVEEPEVEDSEDEDSNVEEPEVEDSEVEEPEDGDSEVEEPEDGDSEVKDSEDEDSNVEEPAVKDSEDEDSNVEEPAVKDSEVEEPAVEEPAVKDSKDEVSKVEEPEDGDSEVDDFVDEQPEDEDPEDEDAEDDAHVEVREADDQPELTSDKHISTSAAPAAAGSAASRKVRLAILSDIHYVVDDTTSEAGAANLEKTANTEMRLMQEIDGILGAALDEASGVNPDVLLVCGDLVSNGEHSGAMALSERLRSSKEKEGLKNTGIYVVNGNHDINNSYAADYSGDTIENAARVQPSDFSTVFAGLGYGDDDHCEGGSHSVYVPTDDPNVMANHGGLSYAADVAEGITLIVLDTAIYRTDESETTRYKDAQMTGGYVSDDLLSWAAEQARAAKEKGNLVLAMSHHGLMPHYSTTEEQAWYMDSFRIPNWDSVADTLADAGVTAVLTGHTHANDIAKHVSKNNNVLYDIETAALCAYPCAWRTLDIEIDGEGDEKTYTFTIDTSLVDSADIEGDTSGWTFTIGGVTKTFDGDYNGDLQDYAYEKTSPNTTTFGKSADYLIKDFLYDIVNGEGGLNGYLQRELELDEGATFGDWAVASLQDAVKRLDGFSQVVSLLGSTYKLALSQTEGESPLMPEFDVVFHSVSEGEDPAAPSEENDGKLTFDLTYIATAAAELIQKAQAKLEEGNWLENNYGTSPLLDDMSKLVEKAVLPSLDVPLEEGNPDSTAQNIMTRAWQSFAEGDEAKQDAEQFAHERELLTGEVMTESLRKDVWREVLNFDASYIYPTFSELMQQRIVEEGKDSLAIVQPKEAYSDYAAYGTLLLGSVSTLSSVLTIGRLLDLGGVNPIAASTVQSVEKYLADLHETLTVDENIPEDTQWSFHTVRFDANGGEVEQSHGLTVEDNRLVDLPVPAERKHYTFDGWFTEAKGGRQVLADEDMTGINALFAHWTYTGKSGGDKSTESETAAEDLHDRFGSRAALHARIAGSEYADPAHVQFCEMMLENIRSGMTRVDMGGWLSLDAQLVSAIEASGKAITLTFGGLRVVIPAGASLRAYADANGSVCVVCLAEAFGYETL